MLLKTDLLQREAHDIERAYPAQHRLQALPGNSPVAAIDEQRQYGSHSLIGNARQHLNSNTSAYQCAATS